MNSRPGTWELEADPSGIVTLWFDRPNSTHNILDSETFLGLEAILGPYAEGRPARALLVRSRKERGFCAGADLKELLACREAAEAEAYMRLGWRALQVLMRLPMPTAAVVHGVCLGGGLELALACRSRVVVAGGQIAEARLGAPEVTLGLVPSWGAISALPRVVGLDRGLGLMIGGAPIGGAEALSVGLVDCLLTPAELATLTDPPAAPPRPPWPPQHGAETIGRWRDSLGSDNEAPTRARHRLLDLLAMDLEHGPEVAQEATLVALGELANSPGGRAALLAFAQRGGGPKPVA